MSDSAIFRINYFDRVESITNPEILNLSSGERIIISYTFPRKLSDSEVMIRLLEK